MAWPALPVAATTEVTAIRRPNRLFIMPRNAARISRKPAVEIDVEHPRPVLVRHPQRETVTGHAGIMDENIETAEAGDGGIDEPFGPFRRRQIGRQYRRFLADLAG